jgi:general stress protein 26
MATPQQLEEKFWTALKADRTMMLGLDGVEDGHVRPMTAQLEGSRGPIWFFSARDNALVQKLPRGHRAIATFASKDHGLFATLHGALSLDNNSVMIDRLWNRSVAAWYKDGKDDPNLALLRFDAEKAEIWLDASSIVAGIKMMLGADPRKEYAGKVAEVDLR